VSCTESRDPAGGIGGVICWPRLAAGLGLLAALSACTNSPPPALTPAQTQTATPSAALPKTTMPAGAPADPAAPRAAAIAAAPRTAAKPPPLAAPTPNRTRDGLRLQAAHRLVAASPEHCYTGISPPILLAIPVLEVELHQDGSVKRILVIRHPKQAQDTVDLAIAAVHRAAPFGNVAHMPKPWLFNETFLFNDERRFKPRTLD
jgi:hypothetical protein